MFTQTLLVTSFLYFSSERLYTGTNIYVGNLSYSARDADLSELFSSIWDKSAKVIMEWDTDRSKGSVL